MNSVAKTSAAFSIDLVSVVVASAKLSVLQRHLVAVVVFRQDRRAFRSTYDCDCARNVPTPELVVSRPVTERMVFPVSQFVEL